MQRREKTRDEVPLRSKDTIRSKHPYHILYKTFISIFNIKNIYILEKLYKSPPQLCI